MNHTKSTLGQWRETVTEVFSTKSYVDHFKLLDRPGTLNPSGFRGEWLGPESNRGHEDFQSSALPTELPSLALPLRNYCGSVPIFEVSGAVKRLSGVRCPNFGVWSRKFGVERLAPRSGVSMSRWARGNAMRLRRAKLQTSKQVTGASRIHGNRMKITPILSGAPRA